MTRETYKPPDAAFTVEKVLTPDNAKLYLNSEAIIVSVKGIRYKARLATGHGRLRTQIERGKVTAHVITILANLGEATSQSDEASLQQPAPPTSEDPHRPTLA
jgi:hypothetical protein